MNTLPKIQKFIGQLEADKGIDDASRGEDGSKMPSLPGDTTSTNRRG